MEISKHMPGEKAYDACEIKRENSECIPKFNREECAILWVKSNELEPSNINVRVPGGTWPKMPDETR